MLIQTIGSVTGSLLQFIVHFHSDSMARTYYAPFQVSAPFVAQGVLLSPLQ